MNEANEVTETKPVKERKTRRSTPPIVQKTWFEAMEALDAIEKKFVRVALKTGDYYKAARECRYRQPFELLGRAHVRAVLLIAAPFVDSNLSAKLSRPFVMEKLINMSLNGEVSAMRILLAQASETRSVRASAAYNYDDDDLPGLSEPENAKRPGDVPPDPSAPI